MVDGAFKICFLNMLTVEVNSAALGHFPARIVEQKESSERAVNLVDGDLGSPIGLSYMQRDMRFWSVEL